MVKGTIVALLMVATMQVSASAQSGYRSEGARSGRQEMRSPEEQAKRQTDRMVASLNLTESQASAVYEANLMKAKEMKPVVEDIKANKEKAEEIRARYDAALKQTLTVDQYAKLEAMKEERQARRRGNGEGHTGRGAYDQQREYPQADNSATR